jgi:hemerythrin-like domain-containing protein
MPRDTVNGTPTTATPTTELVDTSVMPTLHTFFRREFRLAGGVLRAVADGDRSRAGVVADHLDFLARALHHHHTIEDELVWPRLLQRVPEELAPIVHLMESQHERVDGLIQEISAVLPGFRATAGAAERDRLADLFDTLYVHLVEHLDAEEERLLPIAARTLTQAEWDEMGERGRRGTPRRELSLVPRDVPVRGRPGGDRGDARRGSAARTVDRPRPLASRVPPYAVRIHGTPTP